MLSEAKKQVREYRPRSFYLLILNTIIYESQPVAEKTEKNGSRGGGGNDFTMCGDSITLQS